MDWQKLISFIDIILIIDDNEQEVSYIIKTDVKILPVLEI